jgi:tellurite resistance protein TerA
MDGRDLQPGQNVALQGAALVVRLTCEPSGQVASLDASAFLLDGNGRVQGDADFVFFGQLAHPSGAVNLAPDGSFRIDTGAVPPGIERIVLSWSVDARVAGLTAFRDFRSVRLSVVDGGTELRFAPATTGMSESALVLGEIYRRNGAWKLRALGQGFSGGLAPLARQYGVDVAAPAPAAPPPSKPPAAHDPPPPAPRAPPARIDLRKRQPVSLDKPRAGFGEIVLNLNWDAGQAKRGLFGIGGRGIDLDLGCFVELLDGSKAVVQALGDTFGSFQQPPYAQLMGDDRTGASATGETLRINGAHWEKIKRVLVYAFIYEGAANWAGANAVVRIAAPGVPELVVALDEHASHKGLCAIALLENVGGKIKATKHVDYYAGHKEVDRAFKFGFRWVAGRK